MKDVFYGRENAQCNLLIFKAHDSHFKQKTDYKCV